MKDNVNLVSFQAATEEKKSLGLQRRSISISGCRRPHLASNQVNILHSGNYELLTWNLVYNIKLNFTEIHVVLKCTGHSILPTFPNALGYQLFQLKSNIAS